MLKSASVLLLISSKYTFHMSVCCLKHVRSAPFRSRIGWSGFGLLIVIWLMIWNRLRVWFALAAALALALAEWAVLSIVAAFLNIRADKHRYLPLLSVRYLWFCLICGSVRIFVLQLSLSIHMGDSMIALSCLIYGLKLAFYFVLYFYSFETSLFILFFEILILSWCIRSVLCLCKYGKFYS